MALRAVRPAFNLARTSSAKEVLQSVIRHSSFVIRLIAVLVLSSILSNCAKRPDPAASARTFFEQVAAGKAQAAYESAAFGFQAGQSEKAFESVVRELDLSGVTSVQTESPKIEGTSATLRVEITSRAGKHTPFVITMMDETGAWRVFSIHSPRSAETGLAENRFTLVGKSPQITASAERPPPDEKEVRRLVRDNLLAFDQAVANGSFREFYEAVSDKWKEQLTEGQLERAFKPFVEKQFRVAAIKYVDAVFDHSPFVDGDGLLIVSGFYPTQPYQTTFSMKFYYELPRWKLFGIDVNLVK